MKRLPKMRQVLSRALTDPEPGFVSMVIAGANQRPFRRVKMDADAFRALHDGTPAQKSEKENDMSKKSLAPTGHDIAALHFAGDQFQTEAAVKAWLDDGGYEGYTVAKSEDGSFSVTNGSVEFVEGTSQKVEGATPGVTAYVAKIASEEEVAKTEDEAAADKAEANGSSVQPVATAKSEAPAGEEAAKEEAPAPAAATADAAPAAETPAAEDAAKEDATPEDAAPAADTPAAEEVAKTDFDAIMEVVKAESTKRGMSEANDLATMIRILKWMVEDAEWVGLSDAQVAAITDGAKSLITAFEGIVGDVVAAMNTAFGDPLAQKTEEAPAAETPAAEAAAKEDAADEPAAPEAAEATAKEDAPAPEKQPWEVAIEALTKSVADLAAKVEGTTASKSDDEPDAEAERVEKTEDTPVYQTRKGSDAAEPQPEVDSETETRRKAEQAGAAKRFASAMGLSTFVR